MNDSTCLRLFSGTRSESGFGHIYWWNMYFCKTMLVTNRHGFCCFFLGSFPCHSVSSLNDFVDRSPPGCRHCPGMGTISLIASKFIQEPTKRFVAETLPTLKSGDIGKLLAGGHCWADSALCCLSCFHCIKGFVNVTLSFVSNSFTSRSLVSSFFL
jgi:hypothetical protein